MYSKVSPFSKGARNFSYDLRFLLYGPICRNASKRVTEKACRRDNSKVFVYLMDRVETRYLLPSTNAVWIFSPFGTVIM